MAGRPRRSESPYAERARQLGRLIHDERKSSQNITRRELALRSQVSESMIEKIENGRVTEPGLFTINKLGVALGLDFGPVLRSLTEPVRRVRLGHDDGKS